MKAPRCPDPARRRGGTARRTAGGQALLWLALYILIITVFALILWLETGRARASEDVRSRVVDLARSQVGTAYLWGGIRPGLGFDCSGLTLWAWREVGVALPRTAQRQYEATKRIKAEEMALGDLIFFARTDPTSADLVTHVGIWAGEGRMVHAGSTRSGVREETVYTRYWHDRYAGSGRVAE